MAVLRSMLAHFGVDVPADVVRRVTGVSRDCLNAADLVRAARAMGMECNARRLEVEELAGCELPVVVHLRFVHFVVLEAVGRDHVLMNCPASGRIRLSMAQFRGDFTGIVLMMRPGAEFERVAAAYRRERSRWIPLHACLPIWAGALMLYALSAGLIGKSIRGGVGWFVLALALGAVAAVMAQRGASRFAWATQARLQEKLAQAPFCFFAYRSPEVLRDVALNILQVRDSLVRDVLPAVMGLVQAGVVLGIAALVNRKFAAEAAAIDAVWVAAVCGLLRWRRNSERGWTAATRRLFENAFEFLHGPEYHRLGNMPGQFRQAIEAAGAGEDLARLRTWPATAMLEVAPYALAGLNAALAQHRGNAMNAHGALAAMCLGGAAAMLLAPLSRMRGVEDGIRRSVLLLEDVLQDSQDVAEAANTRAADGLREMLAAHGVEFRYNPNAPALLRGVDLTVRAGEQVGITGRSGEGKSTLVECLCGLHQLEHGVVAVDGRVLAEMEQGERGRWVARVDRRPMMLEATLRENLLMGDGTIDDASLQAAVRDACLAELVDALPQGLDTLVEFGGRNFSGGELQRIEITRALARNPKVLVLDDALDALDLATELRMRAGLRRRGCAVLVVGHRAASLEACDRVLHFADGILTESAETLHERAPVVGRSGMGVFSPVVLQAETACTFQEVQRIVSAWNWLRGTAHASSNMASGTSMHRLLAELAKRDEVEIRAVRFREQPWWRNDAGAVLVRGDAGWLGVRARGAGNVLFDPANGKERRLRRDEMPGQDGYVFLARLDIVPRGVAGWKWALLRSSGTDGVWAAVYFAAAVLCALSGVASGRPLREFVLLAATVCFVWAAERTLLRGQAAMEKRCRGMVAGLCIEVDADSARMMEPTRLRRALDGLRGTSEWAFALSRRGSLAMVALLGATIGAAYVNGMRGAVTVMLCAGLVMLLSAVVEWERAGVATAAGETRVAARRWIAAMLYGIDRLRLLGTDGWAMGRWRDRCEEERGLSLRAGVGGSVLAATGWMLAVATVATVQMPVTVAALAMVGALSALEMVRLRAAAADDTRVNAEAEQLLVMRRESGAVDAAAWTRIEARGVTCGYPRRSEKAVEDVSLDVRAGEVTVLTGASGAGKSTLLRVLLGLQQPIAGRVLVDGVPLHSLRMPAWHRSIAGVFQGERLRETVTVRGQLLTGRPDELQRIWQALETVDMADEVRAMPMGLQTIVEAGKISGGQQQRLLIARALLAEPRLLVLDEATNAIPDALQGRIFARLRAQGIGCLMVTHRQSAIEAADKVYVLERTVVFAGSSTEWTQWMSGGNVTTEEELKLQ